MNTANIPFPPALDELVLHCEIPAEPESRWFYCSPDVRMTVFAQFRKIVPSSPSHMTTAYAQVVHHQSCYITGMIGQEIPYEDYALKPEGGGVGGVGLCQAYTCFLSLHITSLMHFTMFPAWHRPTTTACALLAPYLTHIIHRHGRFKQRE